MYMQTALNTWFWKSYLQTVSVCGTIHRQKHTKLLYLMVASQLWEIEIHSAA